MRKIETTSDDMIPESLCKARQEQLGKTCSAGSVRVQKICVHKDGNCLAMRIYKYQDEI
jgi:hypothetical protein